MRKHATVLVMIAVVTIGIVPVGAAGASTQATGAQEAGAMVTFDDQATGGTTVTVDRVTLPEGGFVTIHDASVTEGNVLGSVVGTSAYLSQGTHENVTVRLDEPIDADGTYVAMPHKDTDGDQIYSFVAGNAEADGPYTADGSAVVDMANLTASATVSMSDQPTDGGSVVVDRVELAEGGFVTVHDASVTEGQVFESIRGTSAYLPAGVHENVRVELEDPLAESTTLVPMAHRDTNGNEVYDFADSEGAEDGPYTNEAGAVVDTAAVSLSSTAEVSFDAQATGGHSVVVESAFLPEGGFVTVHDGTVTEGQTFESIRGTSAYLSPGLHRNVRVGLEDPVTESTTLVPMAHRDTNDDRAYGFASSEGQQDGPYTDDDGAVVDTAGVTVSASVTADAQVVDGRTVVLEHVDLAEGGFVTVHDASLGAGDALGSVAGTSAYLEAGSHEDVTVTLDRPLRASQSIVAMAHRDTNGNQAYDFVSSEGAEDGPYVADGGAVVDAAHLSVPAVVIFSGQTSDGETVVIDSVTLSNGGFVTVHDASVTEGQVFESIRGTSAYLGPGTHEDVEVTLDEPLTESTTLVPMAHKDTNGNQVYDFADSEGAEDGPYVSDRGAIVATGQVSVSTSGTATPMPTPTATPSDMDQATEEPTEQPSPGFGIAVAVVALLAAALLAVRRRD